MSPDINSLPPSRSASASPRQPRNPTGVSDGLSSYQTSPSAGFPPASANSMSHQNPNNTATTADLPRRPYVPIPGSERRRSTNLNLSSSYNSHTESGIGDMPLSSDHRSSLGHGLRTSSPSSLGGSPIIATGDPHHQRTPSLGELHQELEQEQEAQVNRLLQTIRSQQRELQYLQQQQQSHQSAVDDTTPRSERSTSFSSTAPYPTPGTRPSTQLPLSLSSRRPSQTIPLSPNIRPLAESSRGPDTLEWIPGANESAGRRSSRDECSFYQAEAGMLARENQILRQRIRDLERQVSELTTNVSSHGPSAATAVPSSSQAPGGEPNADESQSQANIGVGSAGESTDKT